LQLAGAGAGGHGLALVASPLTVTGVVGNGTKRDGTEGVVLLFSWTSIISSHRQQELAALPIPVQFQIEIESFTCLPLKKTAFSCIPLKDSDAHIC